LCVKRFIEIVLFAQQEQVMSNNLWDIFTPSTGRAGRIIGTTRVKKLKRAKSHLERTWFDHFLLRFLKVFVQQQITIMIAALIKAKKV